MKTRLVALLLSLSLVAPGCGSSTSPSGAPQYVYDGCVDYANLICGKLFDCAPAAAKLATGKASKADCGSYAQSLCSSPSVDDQGKACTPVWPTEAQVNACISDSQSWSCADYLAKPEGPPSCQTIEDPCPASSPARDLSVGPSPDLGVKPKADLPPSSVCPYTTPSFSCDAACENLWNLMQKCKSDPSLPSNVQKAFQLMGSLQKPTAIVACKTFCAQDSPSYLGQWKCVQAAPIDDCTKIAGCTVNNCP